MNGEHVVAEPLQHVVESAARPAAARRAARAISAGVARRSAGIVRVGEPVDQQVDDAVPERAHLLGRHAQRVCHRANVPVRSSV